MIQNESLQTLIELGLSLPQAKAYLNLVKLKKADVKTLAKSSNVATQDIYRIMPKLQKMGLVEKIITTPTMYKATPLKEGASILLQLQAKRCTNLEMKTKILQENSQEKDPNIMSQDEDSQFAFISERSHLIMKFEKANQTAKKNIEIVGKWEHFKSDLHNFLQQELRQAMKKGVRIRLIVERQDVDTKTLEVLRILEKNTLFKVRYCSGSFPVKIVIYDDIEVALCVAKQPDQDLPYLWSNNPILVKVMMFQFEEIWNKSKEDEFY